MAVFQSVAAEKRLRLKGAGDDVVDALRKLVPRTAALKPCDCGDPDCKEGRLPSVADSLGKDERFAWYALRAPIDGVVVEKHIVAGESVDSETELFTVADLDVVWVDLAVGQEKLAEISPGLSVEISLPGGDKMTALTTYVSPVVDRESRMALVRADLQNKDQLARPGLFVEAAIQLPSGEEKLLVPKAAVMLVNDHPCVFVWCEGAFELREVQAGLEDGVNIEISSGLQPGEKVASVGAFHLKSEYIKAAAGDLGGHQGCSH